VAIGPYIRGGAWLRVHYVRVEGQQQRGAFLDEAYPGVPVAVHAALVPFGLAEPACQVEGVLGHVRVLTPDKQAGRKARHHVAPMLPGRIVARLALRLQDLKLHLTLGTRAAVGLERRLDCRHIVHVGPNGRLDVVHCRQPPRDVARSTRAALVSRPPLCAARCRWSEACTSSKAAAMRRPGGCKGPP
jgi:hypothetical protein